MATLVYRQLGLKLAEGSQHLQSPCRQPFVARDEIVVRVRHRWKEMRPLMVRPLSLRCRLGFRLKPDAAKRIDQISTPRTNRAMRSPRAQGAASDDTASATVDRLKALCTPMMERAVPTAQRTSADSIASTLPIISEAVPTTARPNKVLAQVIPQTVASQSMRGGRLAPPVDKERGEGFVGAMPSMLGLQPMLTSNGRIGGAA